MKTMVSRTLSVHKEHEFLLKLEAAGLNDDVSQRVIDSRDNEVATRVIQFIQLVTLETTKSQKRARQIMGRNFFGIEEALRHFRANPSRQQLKVMAEVPYTEATLEELKDSHILVAVFPPSNLAIGDFEYSGEDETGWHLICKTGVPNATTKDWYKQRSLLGKDDEVPTKYVIHYTIIGHYLATDERLFERLYVRTSSVSGNRGERIAIGFFDFQGPSVIFWDDCSGDRILGLASARKPQTLTS